MSTGAECNFWEEEPGRWKYRIQHYPYGETDDFDTYGPFVSFKAATDHLDRNHANPGGYSIRIHETGHVHEWERGGDVVIGHEVKIRVESLGADATLPELVKHIQSLPADHPAFKSWPIHGWSDDVTTCESCGKNKETTNAR